MHILITWGVIDLGFHLLRPGWIGLKRHDSGIASRIVTATTTSYLFSPAPVIICVQALHLVNMATGF